MGAPGEAVVCVPARDERERLPRLIRSLAAQDAPEPGGRLRVVILANSCRDGTADAVRAMRDAGETPSLDLRLVEVALEGPEAHVGTARRMALDAGAGWLEAEACADGFLLTTDADARVPPDWVAANRAALAGAEIVGGRLVIDPDAEPDPAVADLNARIERYWAAVRALEDRTDPPPHDPAPRHGDHTGASLGLRADLYRAVGGLPPLPRGEDNALVARVRAAGGRLRHCPSVRVLVSDRAAGRAEGGMAVEMVRRAEAIRTGAPYRLPTAAHWQAVIARRAALRRSWHARGDRTAAWAALGLTAGDLAAVGPETCPNDIAFVERAAPCLDAAAGPAPETELDAALAAFAEILRGPAPSRARVPA